MTGGLPPTIEDTRAMVLIAIQNTATHARTATDGASAKAYAEAADALAHTLYLLRDES